MKLVALVSFYDEKPSWLAALVASLTRAQVDHVVAVDGAYYLFPGANDRPRSSRASVEALTEAAAAAGIGLTLYQPSEPFVGNEVEKRNLMFGLARQITSPEDWYLVIDGDEVVHHAAHDLKDQLAATEANVATYLLVDRENESRNQVRGLMRALPDLRLECAHYLYVHGQGDQRSYLWGRADIHRGTQEDAFDISQSLVLDHRRHERRNGRNMDADTYYARRDGLRIERFVDVWVEGLDGEPLKVGSAG